MSLRSLYLRSFRVYEEAFFEFHEGINYIQGPNAQGKTTILEAIYCLITGRSFRSNYCQDLIQYDQAAFFVEGRFDQQAIEQVLRFHFAGKKRSLFFNQTALPQLASLIGILPGVLITPDDIDLIKGQPAQRRQFVDLQLAQADPLYTHHLTRYLRGVQQRNHLLRSRKIDTLASWEEEMSRSAAYITLQRGKLLQELQIQGQRYHKMLTGEESSWRLDYKTGGVQWEPKLDVMYRHQQELFKKHREREVILGYSLTGPHKDDFSLLLNNKEVRSFASEGQQRSSVIALRLAEWQRLQAHRDDFPLLMIDDVGVGLDKNRRVRLLELLANFHQVFLTGTEASLFDEVQVKGKKITVGV